MRIGIFDPYLDTLGGGEKYIISAALCLSLSHEVFLLWNPSEKEKLKIRIKDKFGLDIGKLPFSTDIFGKDVSFISRLVLSKKFDFIIFLSDGSIPFVLSKLIVHFQFPVEWTDVSLKTKLKFKKIKKIICNSNFTKKYIDDKFNVNSQVIYPPISSKETKEKKEKIILNVGRYGNYAQGSSFKKQEVLIEAFKRMVDSGLRDWKLKFLVSTRKEDEQSLANLVSQTNGYPIEIAKNADSFILKSAYSMAKIYWHAAGYREDLTQYPERAEHFGIATVEAMSAGAVPVVINAGGQKEIVENEKSGLLWESMDELIDKTSMLIADNDKWSKMSKEAVERSVLFSEEKFCAALNKIIK